MTIPNLPTDSLYKFFSIFGLVLFIFGQYVNISQTEELNNEKDLFNYEIKLLNYDIELSNKKTEQFISQIQSKCAQSPCKCKVISLTDNSIKIIADTKNCEADKNLLNEILAIQNSIGEENEKVDRKLIEIKAKEIIIGRKDDVLWARSAQASFISGIGIALSVIGFALWYKRVQQYQDIVLKDQAEKVRIQIDNQNLYTNQTEKGEMS